MKFSVISIVLLLLLLYIPGIQSSFLFSKVWTRLLGKRDVRILMTGLLGAGKTTILNDIGSDILAEVKTVPDAGFNMETVGFKGVTFAAWDLDDSDRSLWKPYYQNTDALIFVVDSFNRDNIAQVEQELKYLLDEEDLQGTVILIFANKQDLSDVMSPNEVTDHMPTSQLRGKLWLVQGTSAVTLQGIKEGFDWLGEVLLKK